MSRKPFAGPVRTSMVGKPNLDDIVTKTNDSRSVGPHKLKAPAIPLGPTDAVQYQERIGRTEGKMPPVVFKNFEFGQGARYPRSHMRTFYAPSMSRTAFSIDRIRTEPQNGRTSVYVDVMKPDHRSIGVGGDDGPVVHTQHIWAPDHNVRLGGEFHSEFGCDSSWRVRVQAIDFPASARISGRIKFSYAPPSLVTLMIRKRPSLKPGRTWEGTLSVDQIFDAPSGVNGAGLFVIRAKWHNWFEYGPARVRLVRPDGRTVAEHTGYSLHAIGATADKMMRFIHFVNPRDARRYSSGKPWSIQVKNVSDRDMWDFDVRSGLDPNFATGGFSSSFQSACEMSSDHLWEEIT